MRPLILLWIASTGCAAPRLTVELDLPKDVATLVSYVDLSVVTLGDGAEFRCQDVAWGRVATIDLAARSDEYHVTGSGADLVNISRDGVKLLYAEARLSDDRLAAVGCEEVGEIERDTTVKLEAEAAAYLDLPTETETFEARLVGSFDPACHDLPLSRACRGVVRDFRGQPIAGRSVAWHLTAANLDEDGEGVTSDEDGTFALPSARPRRHGPYLLALTAYWQAEAMAPLSALFEPAPQTLGLTSITAVALGRFARTTPACRSAPACTARDLAVLGQPSGAAEATIAIYQVVGSALAPAGTVDPALFGSAGARDLTTLATREYSCPEPDRIVTIAPTTFGPSCPSDHQLLEVSQPAVGAAWQVQQTALPAGLCGPVRDLWHVRCDDASEGTLVATFDQVSVNPAGELAVRAFTLGAGAPAPMTTLSLGESRVSTAGCLGNLATQSLEPVVLLGNDDDGGVLLSLADRFPPFVWPNLTAPAGISGRGLTSLPELFAPRAVPSQLSLSSHLLGVGDAASALTLVDRQVIPVLGVPWALAAAHLDDDDLPDVVALFKIAGDAEDAGLFLTLVALGRMRDGRHIAALSLPHFYVAPVLHVSDLDGDCVDDIVVTDAWQAAPSGEPSLIEVRLTQESPP